MQTLINQYQKLIQNEFININNKLFGTNYSEILRLNLLNNEIHQGIEIDISKMKIFEETMFYENETKKINYSLSYNTSPAMNFNKVVNFNTIFICLHGVITIDIVNKNKKLKTFNIYKRNGISIPNLSEININFSKNCLKLEINIDELKNEVENN